MVVFWPSQRIDGGRIPLELVYGYILENDRAELAILVLGIQNDFTYQVDSDSRRIQVVDGAQPLLRSGLFRASQAFRDQLIEQVTASSWATASKTCAKATRVAMRRSGGIRAILAAHAAAA